MAPIGYITVDDIKESMDLLVATGATIVQDVRDVGGGLHVAAIKDADGKITGLRQQT